MVQLVYTLAVALLAVLFTVAAVALDDWRNRALLRRWAEREGWTLVATAPVLQPPLFINVRGRVPAFRVRATNDGRVFRDGLVMLGRGFILPAIRGTRVLWDGDEVTGGFPVIPIDGPRK